MRPSLIFFILMITPVRTDLKTGQRPVQLDVRAYKPGEVLFEEGTKGRELFIIAEGKVGVYKNTPDGIIELAIIENSGIIGEMSLLDNMPRSATVKAISPTKVTIVNEGVFHAALEKVPVWLTSIVKIVVSRLRDTNKRVDQAVLRDKERGVAALLVLLLPSYKHEFGSLPALDYELLLLEAYFVCRLKKKEITGTLDAIQKRGLISIQEDTTHKRHIVIQDLQALKLFEEFLVLKSQQKSFREANIPDDVVATLSNIAYVAQKSGVDAGSETTLKKSALLADLSDKNPDRLEHNLLNLRRRNLINTEPDGDDVRLVFNKDDLNRIKKIKEWLPKFEQKIDIV